MNSSSFALLALLIVAVVFVVLLRGRAAEAEAEALAWNARADSALDYAAHQRQRAEASYQNAQQAQRWADSVVAAIEPETDTLRVEVERVRLVEVPDTCRHVVAQRDSIIDRYANVVVGWRTAYDHQVRSTVRLHRAYAMTAFALDSVSTVLKARPKPRSRWLPELRPGVFAGACASGPCAGVGIALTWRF